MSLSVDKEAGRERLLRDLIPKRSIGAEIGVFRGEFSRRILDIAAPTKLHLIDSWWTSGQKEWSWAKGNRSVVEGYISVVRAFEDELVTGRVILHVGSDFDLLPTFPDSYFDWVYLDTSHKYEKTKRELDLLRNKVRADGIIAGDDWNSDPTHRHHGLYLAVQDFLATHPYELVYLDEPCLQWAIRRKR